MTGVFAVTTKSINNIETWINFYQQQGFSIIPLKEKDKRPNIPSWEKYQKQHPSKEEITEWLNQDLFKNIGIVCGAVSNNLVVIDIDDKHIVDELNLKYDKIIDKGHWIANTGKGYHIYCKHNSDPGSIVKDDTLHLEYRANGGYVVAPPSIHPNGDEYQFFYCETIESLPLLKSEDVKQVFDDMVTRLQKKRGIKKTVKKSISEVKKGVAYGMRNDTAFKLACQYRSSGLTREETTKLMMDWNSKNKPPLHDNEIINCIRSAYKETIEISKKRELLKKYKVVKFKKIKDAEGNEIYKPMGAVPPRLAKLIMGEYGYNFLTTKDNQEIFLYNSGCYKPDGETVIQNLVEHFLEDLSTTHIKNEVVDFIKDYHYEEREIFEPDINLLNLENGVYNITTGELCSHSPDYYFINKLPITYDPKAKCPKIIKFLEEVVYKDELPVIQEFFGYCLYRKYHIHRACMFLGGGKNGKSTVIRLLVKLLGESNVANKPLQELINYRFARHKLYGKLLNAAADISDQALRQTGLFKQLTGEDRVDAEKKFKDSYEFTNYAKFLFSANKLPKTDDESYAFFRRWILISFPNTFEGKNCNPNILDEITTPEELSGLFNWAIQGLQRLLTNRDFSYGKSVEEVMEQYKTLSDPVYAYCQEFLKCDTGKHILKGDLWEHYTKWCKKNKLPITPKNILTGELSNHLPEIRTGKPGGRGKRKPAYMNIFWQNPDTKLTGVDA